MSAVRFRKSPSYASGQDDYQLSVSDDGQVFTLTFSDLQAVIDKAMSPTAAARLFSLVLPVDGGADGVDIFFRASGFALTTEGSTAHAVLSVNGQTTVDQFPAGIERDFVQELRFEAGPTCECGLAVSVLAQRDPANPDAAAHVNVLSVDASINPISRGKFVLSAGSAGDFRFAVVSADGVTLATSESCETKAVALDRIELVRSNARGAELDDRT